jgi:hypothetical protein
MVSVRFFNLKPYGRQHAGDTISRGQNRFHKTANIRTQDESKSQTQLHVRAFIISRRCRLDGLLARKKKLLDTRTNGVVTTQFFPVLPNKKISSCPSPRQGHIHTLCLIRGQSISSTQLCHRFSDTIIGRDANRGTAPPRPTFSP